MSGLRLVYFGYFLSLCLIGGSNMPPRGSGILGPVPATAFGAVLLTHTIWRHWWSRNTPAAKARAEIDNLLSRSGDSGAWVTPDDQTRLVAYRTARDFEWTVLRVNRDHVGDIDDPDHVTLTMEAFTFSERYARVPRTIDGAVVTYRRHVRNPTPGRKPDLRWHLRAYGWLPPGRDAYSFASSAELTELAGQFRGAEYVGSA